jgi:hypothetical protein
VLLITVAALVVLAAGTSIWRMTRAGSGSNVDAAAEARAEQLRSEIQDYTPPEQNVPDTAPKPEKLQTQHTRQPQKVN